MAVQLLQCPVKINMMHKDPSLAHPAILELYSIVNQYSSRSALMMLVERPARNHIASLLTPLTLDKRMGMKPTCHVNMYNIYTQLSLAPGKLFSSR
jgi:hypothetical protein